MTGKAIMIGATKRTSKKNQVTTPSAKRQKTYKVSDSLKKKSTISIGDAITVKEFSEKM